jgi:hypothetical protein
MFGEFSGVCVDGSSGSIPDCSKMVSMRYVISPLCICRDTSRASRKFSMTPYTSSFFAATGCISGDFSRTSSGVGCISQGFSGVSPLTVIVLASSIIALPRISPTGSM